MKRILTGVMRNDGVSVRRYSAREFAKQLAHASGNTVETVRDKQHFQQLHARLLDLGVTTLVTESSYTDRDFLDDYAAYYVRCLDKYKSRCVRLHFFAEEIGAATLKRMCTGQMPERLSGNYKGFLVVKHLPETFIGRTCLLPAVKLRASTARNASRKRLKATAKCRCIECDAAYCTRKVHFVARPYTAHLLGLDLTVRALAFQEQDHATAACATSALWSVFHATGKLFDHPISTPVEITRHATDTVGYGRSFPNAGLEILQMAVAVKKAGLDPEVVPVPDRAFLQAITYAYVSAGVPLPLVCRVLEHDAQRGLRDYGGGAAARHAVAVSGLRWDDGPARAYGPSGLLLRSSSVSGFVVHDDQIGPHVPMDFVSPPASPLPPAVKEGEPPLSSEGFLSSSWRGTNGGDVFFAAECLILPLYHKVRITFSEVLEAVKEQDRALEWVRLSTHYPVLGAARLTWDIHLTKESAIKSRVRKTPQLDAAQRYAFLRRPLPRFLWSATAYQGDEPVVEFLFDATDIAQSDFLLAELRHRKGIARALALAPYIRMWLRRRGVPGQRASR